MISSCHTVLSLHNDALTVVGNNVNLIRQYIIGIINSLINFIFINNVCKYSGVSKYSVHSHLI